MNHYSIIIEWSDENQCYLVTSPEWADQYIGPITDGNTLGEAALHAQDALETMIDVAAQEGKPLPAPRAFAMTHA